MTYEFIPEQGVETDPKFEGIVWEIDKLDDPFYMEGGQFSIAVEQVCDYYKSLSTKANRQGIFVCITHKDV